MGAEEFASHKEAVDSFEKGVGAGEGICLAGFCHVALFGDTHANFWQNDCCCCICTQLCGDACEICSMLSVDDARADGHSSRISDLAHVNAYLYVHVMSCNCCVHG